MFCTGFCNWFVHSAQCTVCYVSVPVYSSFMDLPNENIKRNYVENSSLPHSCIWRLSQSGRYWKIIPLFDLYFTPPPQSRQSAKLVLQSSELGLPQPFTRRPVCPPPFWFRWEGHTRWRERGWESANSDEGTYTVVVLFCCFSKRLQHIRGSYNNSPI